MQLHRVRTEPLYAAACAKTTAWHGGPASCSTRTRSRLRKNSSGIVQRPAQNDKAQGATCLQWQKGPDAAREPRAARAGPGAATALATGSLRPLTAPPGPPAQPAERCQGTSPPPPGELLLELDRVPALPAVHLLQLPPPEGLVVEVVQGAAHVGWVVALVHLVGDEREGPGVHLPVGGAVGEHHAHALEERRVDAPARHGAPGSVSDSHGAREASTSLRAATYWKMDAR
eukprot:CAMPEP_0206007054 /NCGR_PEP_ID=MMETSP1464-20131121/5535_1 /ASSEMBLY_ACC=CAM_ASM_001124 /TAXON_ID=119497 /ORGANISM="Exanthemachrysis gayraliae, Strain RCC1523" /LENGTH=229 /DNA_ID=CAMNT_0053380543 /DNA_START=103 /DNA_END=789 /DNA_ORIENTATION=-